MSFINPEARPYLTEHQAPEFEQIQQKAKDLGTELHYRRIDVRDTELLNSVIESIANDEGRMDGLVAAAGIQQETSALDYSAKDSNTMFEVNVTGVFMTSQAVAKQMIRFGNGGSIAMIASMSGTVANRVRSPTPLHTSHPPIRWQDYPFLKDILAYYLRRISRWCSLRTLSMYLGLVLGFPAFMPRPLI